LVDTEGFRSLGALYRSSHLQMKYIPFGVAATLVGAGGGGITLCGLVRRRIQRYEGIAIWLAHGSFRRMHPLDFQSCHDEYGYETLAWKSR
jgi:hypothetical protein